VSGILQTKRSEKIAKIVTADRNLKRILRPERSDVNETLFKWFKQGRSDSVPVSGPLFMINLFFIILILF